MTLLCRDTVQIGARRYEAGGSYELSGSDAETAKRSGAFVEVHRRIGRDKAFHDVGITVPGQPRSRPVQMS